MHVCVRAHLTVFELFPEHLVRQLVVERLGHSAGEVRVKTCKAFNIKNFKDFHDLWVSSDCKRLGHSAGDVRVRVRSSRERFVRRSVVKRLGHSAGMVRVWVSA